MKCPNCDTTLAMSERLGVEIDYCPQCRGVWLDRGEIDRLLEAERAPRARVGRRGPGPGASAPCVPRGRTERRGHDEQRRKRSWSDLLDFG